MPKFCGKCGTEVTERETFCHKCGLNLNGTIQAIKFQAAIPTEKKSPRIAAILNFLIAGVGYIYLGKWVWGILAFIFVGAILGSIFILFGGLVMGTLLYLPIDVILAWHAYKLAKDINKEPGLQQTIIPSSIVEYAGFWRRLAATIIDVIIINIAGLFIGLILGLIVYKLSTGTIEILGRIVQVLVGWLYYAVMESSSAQATIGKEAIGIVVTDLNGNRISFGKATIRHFGKIISALILLIGFIMIGFTEKKQGLHDMIAGCLVIMKK